MTARIAFGSFAGILKLALPDRAEMRFIATVSKIAFFVTMIAVSAHGQPYPPSLGVKDLIDSLHSSDNELQVLQYELEAATVDQRMLEYTDVKAWVLSNTALRDSVFFALIAADSSVQTEAGADAFVLATNDNDLIEVRFGSAVFKGTNLKTALARSSDKDLYRRIAESYSYSKNVELRDTDFKIPTPFTQDMIAHTRIVNEFGGLTLRTDVPPSTRILDISAFGLQFKLSGDWGAEVKIGNDEIGYPFWSSGKMAFLAAYKHVKLGFELPFAGGRSAYNLFPPFTIRSRRLNGSRGIFGQFDFGVVGGTLSITRLTDSDTRSLVSPELFYYISGIAQLYFSFGIHFTPTILARAKVGGGLYRVNQASMAEVPPDPTSNVRRTIIPGPQQNQIGPYLEFEYLAKDGPSDRFRASVQFFDLTLLLAGSIAIVQDVLSIEMKYSWPMGQNRPWQNPEFLIVSPHIMLTF